MCAVYGCQCADTQCAWYAYTCMWCKKWAPIKFNNNGEVISPQGLVDRLAKGECMCTACRK